VIFGIDNTSASRATSENLLVPLGSGASSDVPDRYKLNGEAGKRLVPIDAGDVCVNFDAEWFDSKNLTPPTRLEDLTDPRYKDLLVVESPVTSSPGLALLAGSVDRFGADGWADWWQQLKDNGVRIRPSWDDAYFTDYTVSGGDRPMVLSYASSPPAEVVLSEGKRTVPASKILTDSCVNQVEYAGVLRGAPNLKLARQLVKFMVDPVWQSELPLTNYVFPVVDGVPLPVEFTKWAERAVDPLNVDSVTIDRNRDAWLEQWRNIFE
jgi:thiamine transport system substrate-binding protein